MPLAGTVPIKNRLVAKRELCYMITSQIYSLDITFE